MTLKSDQDPDPHVVRINRLPGPGSGSGSGSALGSGPALKPMRIHNTGIWLHNFRCLFYDLLPSGAAGQHSADALGAANRNRLSVGGSVSARRTGAVPAGWSGLSKRGDNHPGKHSSYCSLIQVLTTEQFTF